MPMDFPDLKSLKRAAKVHGFRDFQDKHFFRNNIGCVETEEEYREALANHARSHDAIESDEIRYGIGWDRWSDEQKRASLMRGI